MTKNYQKMNNFPHGIMFHNFHDNKKYKKGDGSLSEKDLTKLIKFIGRKNILNAKDFINNYKNNLKILIYFTKTFFLYVVKIFLIN